MRRKPSGGEDEAGRLRHGSSLGEYAATMMTLPPVPLNAKGYTVASWFGVVVLAGGMLVVLISGNWLQTLQGGLFLAGAFALVCFNDRLPSLLVLLFVISAVVNAAGWVWNEYRTIYGYDEFAHLFTTFAVTLSLGFLTYRRVQHHFRHHRLHFILVISSFGISLGALWEVFEWTLLGELSNPVVDIIMDSIGAALAGVAAPWLIGAEPNRS